LGWIHGGAGLEGNTEERLLEDTSARVSGTGGRGRELGCYKLVSGKETLLYAAWLGAY
jgi:hypothetical protein